MSDESHLDLSAEPAQPAAAPVILLVDADPVALESARAGIARRFGVDYFLVVANSFEQGLRLLDDMVQSGREVALVAADCDLPGAGGVALLEAAHDIDRHATRILLIAMDEHQIKVPLGRLPLVREATALGRIDAAWVKGWDTPEEWLYPQLQESLTTWTRLHRPRHLVYQIVGEQWAPRSHHLRESLSRNGVPFRFYAVDSEEGRLLVERHAVDLGRLPALIHRGGTVLQDPEDADVGALHGVATSPSSDRYDLLVVGAGPAGLAAAVYSASEGLRTLVVEPEAIGGQAGTSSMIRNYLGFPRGLSGGELAHRAWEQAVLLGAEFAFTHAVCAVDAADGVIELMLSDQSPIRARAVIIATGVNYRRIAIPALERLAGVGAFYGAAGAEAPALAGQPVTVVGGANSAGQAALHLARYASHVTLVVRAASLEKGMSQYLIDEIRATRNLTVRLHTQVVDAHGDARLESLTVEDLTTGVREDLVARGLFILIGGVPRTEWLAHVQRDDHGFLLTGRDLASDSGKGAGRAPFPFETSIPGVFAAGDVRHGSVKRVAGAVGEGSATVGAVHQYLATLPDQRATDGVEDGAQRMRRT